MDDTFSKLYFDLDEYNINKRINSTFLYKINNNDIIHFPYLNESELYNYCNSLNLYNNYTIYNEKENPFNDIKSDKNNKKKNQNITKRKTRNLNLNGNETKENFENEKCSLKKKIKDNILKKGKKNIYSKY